MASSSGCAINRQIRLLVRRGKEARAICAVYNQHVVSTIGIAKVRYSCILQTTRPGKKHPSHLYDQSRECTEG